MYNQNVAIGQTAVVNSKMKNSFVILQSRSFLSEIPNLSENTKLVLQKYESQDLKQNIPPIIKSGIDNPKHKHHKKYQRLVNRWSYVFMALIIFWFLTITIDSVLYGFLGTVFFMFLSLFVPVVIVLLFGVVLLLQSGASHVIKFLSGE